MQKIQTRSKRPNHSRKSTLETISIPKENNVVSTYQQNIKNSLKSRHLRERHKSVNFSTKFEIECGSPIDFECNEILEIISYPCKPTSSGEIIFDNEQILTPKGSNSFIQEFHGVQAPPPEFETSGIEEISKAPHSHWKPENKDYIKSMIEKEYEYMPNPFALQSIQANNITATMRAILYDWMMEVSSEFTLKRETFHLSITYVDRFLSIQKGIKKDEFQLIGLAAMYIAAKTEEVYAPKISEWAKSADNGYSLPAIKMMEKIILSRLDWKIFPATIYNWTNWLMSQWDKFVEFHFGCVNYNKPKDFDHLPPDQKKKEQKKLEKRLIVFKYSNHQAYKRFRESLQVLDIGVLDIGIAKITPRIAASGLLYLMISKFFYQTNYNLLYYSGPDYHESPPVFEENECNNISMCFGDGEEGPAGLEDHREAQNFENARVVQQLYSGFISASCDIKNIEEIYESVAFFHPFLEFEIVYDLPLVCKVQSKEKLESHYEEFLAYQTHNEKNVDFVTKKLKNQNIK
ncbi:unnamed protein product [Blepharisma stoltei]|uniref:Cyclin-like domain-containing protein n=1 Tax=Blepharisma stoltei TaxID=1481888 RepID=A0AAU9JS44_9CILI|nr:unnamed protein product [Blepharisma stoltei]